MGKTLKKPQWHCTMNFSGDLMNKLRVGVLGATGMVGQSYVSLLEGHPWFEVTHVIASPSSAGKKYADAVLGRWHMKKDIPQSVGNLEVHSINDVENAGKN